MNFGPSVAELVAGASRALVAARNVSEIKHARDLAEAARSYARRANGEQATLFCAACLTIRAEHELGTALSKTDLAKAAPGNQYTGKKKLDRSHAANGPRYLRDLHVTGSVSHRAQQLAALTRAELEHWLASQCAAGVVPTLAAARRHAKEVAGANGRGRKLPPTA
ncbi:MAG: hypothetical protein WD851_14225 [Pirellulales bacterium]